MALRLNQCKINNNNKLNTYINSLPNYTIPILVGMDLFYSKGKALYRGLYKVLYRILYKTIYKYLYRHLYK